MVRGIYMCFWVENRQSLCSPQAFTHTTHKHTHTHHINICITHRDTHIHKYTHRHTHHLPVPDSDQITQHLWGDQKKATPASIAGFSVAIYLTPHNPTVSSSSGEPRSMSMLYVAQCVWRRTVKWINLMWAFTFMCDLHPPSSGGRKQLHVSMLSAGSLGAAKELAPRSWGAQRGAPCCPTGAKLCVLEQVFHCVANRACWGDKHEPGGRKPSQEWEFRVYVVGWQLSPMCQKGIIQADLLCARGSDMCGGFHWETYKFHISYVLGQLGKELETS